MDMKIDGIKFLPVTKLRELLEAIPQDALVCVNRVGNLAVYKRGTNDRMNMVGWIDFLLDGEYESNG